MGQLTRTETVLQGAARALKRVAAQQNVSEHRLKEMRFDIACQYDMTRDVHVLHVQWRDPDGVAIRGFNNELDPTLLQDPDRLCEVLSMTIEQINLRGELFYFKLHRHFPNRIEDVKCRADRTVTVTFKNGRSLTVDEAEISSTEFLATCGMIYDL
jgi:hypothetical protein